ncbi:MAG: diacylglycerol kinase family lipid kinase [Clostridiales bacterium]|nr:diacylglycerol kinase family lipid kinase [Clostridiales bacterium]
MNLCFIVNPIAGKGKNPAINAIPVIEKYCRDRGINFKIKKTSYKGHAIVLAQEASSLKSKYDAIISVGGDGTFLEIVNGLQNTEIPLGIIPSGSGNDFVRSIGVPRDIEAALDIIVEKKTRIVDIGHFNNIFFANVASVGFDAEIARDVGKFRKLFPGGAAYYVAALTKFFTYKFKSTTLTIDGEKHQFRILLAAIANGNYYGGGMKVNPQGDLNDGYLDIIVITAIPRYKVPLIMTQFVKGTYQKLPFVKTFRCKEISIESPDELIINADGEVFSDVPLAFNVEASALNVICG